ncbi:MAG: prepilin-type N-terminal cleavage/methylation domain-containing protein [Bacilli bacterium]|nr:prepilin-type N-terminal cleavage/methylation domain-containing protein [Bacilli bacterium]
MNQKGFTMVEILATITILSILMVMAIAGYTSYADYARNRAYKVLASSAATAAEEYVMDHPGAAVETKLKTESSTVQTYIIKETTAPGITFETLVNEGYLGNANDPSNKGSSCKGRVTIGLVKGEGKGALDQFIYVVDECCSGFKNRYSFTFQRIKKTEGGVTTYDTVSKTIESLNGVVCTGY